MAEFSGLGHDVTLQVPHRMAVGMGELVERGGGVRGEDLEADVYKMHNATYFVQCAIVCKILTIYY